VTQLEAAMERFGSSVLDHAGQVWPLSITVREVR
jgi:hypothetical protein